MNESAGAAHLLEQAGIEAVYGSQLPSLAGIAVIAADPRVAPALAEAHAWHHGRAAVVATPDGRLRLGPTDAASGQVMGLTQPEDAPGVFDALRGWAAAQVASPGRHPQGVLDIAVDLDPATPLPPLDPGGPPPSSTWSEVPSGSLRQIHQAERPLLLVGPGVVTAGAVPGLQALAAAADLGVLNTWGAKGVFDWRSRHHWATVGLQRDDLHIGGADDGDLVLLCGIDVDELPRLAPDEERFAATTETQSVPPAWLAPLAEAWRRSDGRLEMPPLRAGLAEVTQRGWTRTTAPLAPTKVTQHYAEALAGGGFVAAAPGRAGYWVARTFATTSLGGARVPARRQPVGLALACAIVAGPRPGRRRPLVVADGPLDPSTAEVHALLFEVADRLRVPVALELWDPDGARLAADEHQNRLAAQLASPRSSVASLATDRTQLDEMIEVAGPVTAWGGLTAEELQ